MRASAKLVAFPGAWGSCSPVGSSFGIQEQFLPSCSSLCSAFAPLFAFSSISSSHRLTGNDFAPLRFAAENRGEAGPARQQGQAEGHEGRRGADRHRHAVRGHGDAQDDGDRYGGPGGRGEQAAQDVDGVHRLGRPGQGAGEEEGRGRQEGRRRRQEGRREEGRREEAGDADGAAAHGAHVHQPATGRVRPVHEPPLLRAEHGGRPQLLRHLLSARALQVCMR